MLIEAYLPSFPDGKRKAFTLGYDDGPRQDARLIGLMEQYGISGTFNLNSGRRTGPMVLRPHPAGFPRSDHSYGFGRTGKSGRSSFPDERTVTP